MTNLPRTARALAIALAMGLLLTGAASCRGDSPAFKKADLGRALAERGEDERALKNLREAIAMDPDLVMAHEALAQAYERMGRYTESIAAYRDTVRLDPVRDTAYARLGCLLLATEGATPEAEAALRQAVEINTTHDGAHACLGAVHLERREFAEAIAETRRAVSLNPQSIQGHLTLGIALAETGDKARGTAEIERAIDYAGDDQSVVMQARMYLQGLAHPDMGDDAH